MKKTFVLGLLIAMAGAASAQTPPVEPFIPWDQAQLVWAPSTEFASGGSLADPSSVLYIVEASAPGGNGWGPIAITKETTYRVKDLWPGVWQFRIKAFFYLSGYSPPGPIASKTIVEPVVKMPTDTSAK
jgi:hypothetical protein